MKCKVCDNDKLEKIIDLPNFPFTGIFIYKAEKFQSANQGLLYCEKCGHAQLENFISYDKIYDNSYSYRGSKSPLAIFGNNFFYNFLIKTVMGNSFNAVIDLGCNDLYLLKKVSSIAKNLYGIDPIWKKYNGTMIDNIHIIGDIIENIDLRKNIKQGVDLIISSHTIEHLHNPRQELEKIVENSCDDAMFFIEVPSFDTLINNNRFDQVFHQHVNYFSLLSMKKLIEFCGCEYINHSFNYNFWGGTMLFAFKKNKNRKKGLYYFEEKQIGISKIRKSYKIFKELLQNMMSRIRVASNRKYFGYGAAQMVPTLAYHMNSDLSFLECIYDDNESKDGLKYPGLKPEIKYLSDKTILENKDILILALDSLKTMLPKFIELAPRKIIIPLDIA